MKHLTKENVILVLVSLLVLAQVKEMFGTRKRPEPTRAAIQERMRGMGYGGQQGPRTAPQKPVWLDEKKAEGRGKKRKVEDQ